MSLPVNNKNSGKPGSKGPKANAAGSKFIAKPGAKEVVTTKKLIKTGGSMGGCISNSCSQRLFPT